jgi:cytochrome c556
MTHVRILFVVALALSTLTVLALPAAASAPAASGSAFCKPITGISEKLKDASTDASKFDPNTFKQFASALRASAKNAPAKVKKAGRALASFYGALGGGDPSAFKDTANVSTAVTTYFTYVATHCN